MGGGGSKLFICPYPLKVQARPPRDKRLGYRSGTHEDTYIIDVHSCRASQMGSQHFTEQLKHVLCRVSFVLAVSERH